MLESLTNKQREIVFDRCGKFVVRACPGSGKTYCVGARLARLISKWERDYEGIAALSFTNVAWQEIDKEYGEHLGSTRGVLFPHFLGTIDSFVDRFIFLPHGHLVLKCKKRPQLVGEPHGIWTGKYYSDSLFDNLSFNIEGKPFPLDPSRMRRNWQHSPEILRAKRRLLGAGFATQHDANYFAMRILEGYPAIARALALRFPFLIVDEAQDTSEIQMRIIDLLIANGLNEVMLVGDPDQAIFEWNEAKPELLDQKYREWPDSTTLNENRRSSQKICDFTFGLSSLPKASESVDESVRTFEYQPKVITYAEDLPSIVGSFLAECTQHGVPISNETVAVLYRSKDLIRDITQVPEIHPSSSVWKPNHNYTKDFAKGKWLCDNGDPQSGLKSIEKAMLKMRSGAEYCLDKLVEEEIARIGFTQHRTNVFSIAGILPVTDLTIGEWVDAANVAFKGHNLKYEFSVNRKARDFSFEQVFLHEKVTVPKLDYRKGTVHSVKGETFDATLLILRTKGVGRAYKTLLQEHTRIMESEELRIAYVGLTRPRKILVLAVPREEDKQEWERRLGGGALGF